MKRNDIPILLATAAYSYLFYMQSAGFNYLLFSLLLVLLLLIRDASLIRSRAFIAAAAGYLVSGLCVFWYGTTLPFLANLLSLVLVAGISFDRESSFIIAWLHSFFSIVGSFIFMLTDAMNNYHPEQVVPGRSAIFKKALLAVIPFIIFLAFFFIYRSGNPIFDQLASRINFDFISLPCCFFTLGGFLLMYGFFRQHALSFVQEQDHKTSDELLPISHEGYMNSVAGNMISVSSLVYTGTLLLALLNVLLATVNGIDVFYLGVLHTTPPGVTFSQYLHNGTDSLIASIILAVAIILFYFRGYLNFYENNKWLKRLAYIWIVQNILLVLSTAWRNSVYISDYGLTHKRIGVYVYLLLCVVGLVTTFVKISKRKNNWFLFRKNAWIFYAVMIIACPFDWDSIITTFNISRFQSDRTMEIDQRYLVSLGHTNLAQLFQYYIVEEKTLHAQDDSTGGRCTQTRSFNEQYTGEIKNLIWVQYDYLKNGYGPHDWQSHCMTKSANLHAIEKMIKDHDLHRQGLPVQTPQN